MHAILDLKITAGIYLNNNALLLLGISPSLFIGYSILVSNLFRVIVKWSRLNNDDFIMTFLV